MWSYEEWKLFWEMLNSMPEFSIGEKPVAESVRFDGIHDGKRNTEKQASLYDAMYAEFLGEKDARLRKYLRKHELRNDNHPVRKEKRKAYVKEKCYSCDPWHGWNTVRNFRHAEKIRTDAEDYKIELRNIADDAEQFNEWLKYA